MTFAYKAFVDPGYPRTSVLRVVLKRTNLGEDFLPGPRDYIHKLLISMQISQRKDSRENLLPEPRDYIHKYICHI